MAGKKYTAYVGSNTYTGNAKGITIYDVDTEKGSFVKRTELETGNSAYLAVSRDKKTLYSAGDEGITAYRIKENGSLGELNFKKINGMRASHLHITPDQKYIFASGYHDGKLTILRLEEDGRLGEIAAERYHSGLTSAAERLEHPHLSCAKLSPDGRYILAADPGIDHVSVYDFNRKTETIRLADVIRCVSGSHPYHLLFSDDGRFLYLMYEATNRIDVISYSADPDGRQPEMEKIQSVTATGTRNAGNFNVSTCLRFAGEGKYLFCSNAGGNDVTLFERDAETGLLTPIFNLPISGEYPMDMRLFPGEKHMVFVNHESNSLTFFRIDYENKYIAMCAREVSVGQPNCCVIVPLSR